MSIDNLKSENDNMSDDYLRSLPETLQPAIEQAEDRIAYIPTIQQKIEVPETTEDANGNLVSTTIELDNPEWHSELNAEKTQLQEKVDFFKELISEINANNYAKAKELISDNAELLAPTPFSQNCFNPDFEIASKAYDYSNYNLTSHSLESGYTTKTSTVNKEISIIKNFLSNASLAEEDWFYQYLNSTDATAEQDLFEFQKSISWIFLLASDYAEDFYLKRQIGGHHVFYYSGYWRHYYPHKQFQTNSSGFSSSMQSYFKSAFGVTSSTWDSFLKYLNYTSNKEAAWRLFKDHLLRRLRGESSYTPRVSKFFIKYTQASSQNPALGFYNGTGSSGTKAIYYGKNVSYNTEIENYKSRYLEILDKLRTVTVPEEVVQIDSSGNQTKGRRGINTSLYYDVSSYVKNWWFYPLWNNYTNSTSNTGLLRTMRYSYAFVRRTFYEKDFITGQAINSGKHQAQYGKEQFLKTKKAYYDYINASSSTSSEKHLIYLQERMKFDFYINYYLWALDYVLYQFSVLSKIESELCQLEVDIANSCVD